MQMNIRIESRDLNRKGEIYVLILKKYFVIFSVKLNSEMFLNY